jgi:1-acyl-sn-glycerol-3-phosphate acyltransferase
MPSASESPLANALALVRSGLFYAAFYLGSIGFVVAAAVMTKLSPRVFGKIVRGWSGFHRHCARYLLGIRIRLEGEPSATPVLYALRHESFFEAIDLPWLLGNPAIVAKAELMKIPLWGPAAQRWGLISVQRDQGAKALRQMVAEAQARVALGRPLAIFPEGTRVPSGERRELQSGFAALYKLLGLPVVPVAIDSGRLYHRWIKRPGVVTYRFDEPIPPGLKREELEQRVLEAINRLNR